MEIKDELRGVEWPFNDNPVAFFVEAAFSSRLADLDNVIKPLLDTFQSIYEEFNDNKVYYVELQKRIVPKGEEYIKVRVGLHSSRLQQANKQKVSEQVQQNKTEENKQSQT